VSRGAVARSISPAKQPAGADRREGAISLAQLAETRDKKPASRKVRASCAPAGHGSGRVRALGADSVSLVAVDPRRRRRRARFVP
jgi:hypothetical protein